MLASPLSGSHAMETPNKEEWLMQCAQRIAEVDPQLTAAEARQLARDLQNFERTAAMAPAAAVAFVVQEMARPGGRFERRLKTRSGDLG
jgi:hypothetical protein